MSRVGWIRDRNAGAKFKRRTVCPDCGEAILIFSGGRVLNATHNPAGISHAITCTGGPGTPQNAA